MEEQLKKAEEILKAGGTILYPTDTVWAVGCDATNAKAVKKIYKVKDRSIEKNCLIIVEDKEKLTKYLRELHIIAIDLMNSIDRPLTIVYPNAQNLAKNLVAEDGSIGIRVINHEFCQKLLKNFDKPIVSTSANISGEETPLKFNQITQDIIDRVDYVIDLDKEKVSDFKPSTVIKLSETGEFTIIRE